MLEKMRKTRFIGTFVTSAYFIQCIHRYDRCVFVFMHNQSQAIVQHKLFKFYHTLIDLEYISFLVSSYSMIISFTISATGLISWIHAETWPISNSPLIISPSNIPFFALP